MIIQPASRKRCASCNRWAGPRIPAQPAQPAQAAGPGEMVEAVEIGSETDTGLCVGGPWDGSERRARSACGQWVLWHAINPDLTGKS